MKKVFFILFYLVAIVNITNAANLNKFSIDRVHQLDDTDNYITVSQNSDYTRFTAQYTITRALKSYGLENLNWRVSIVAICEGYSSDEIQLSSPVILTHNDYLSQPYNDLEISCSISKNLLGYDYAEIRLKYEPLLFDDNSGNLISTDREVKYSTKFYVITHKELPNPFIKADLKLFSTYYSRLRKASFVTGGEWTFSEDWANVKGITSLDGFLYIVQAGNLHRVSPETGEYTILGLMGDWNGTEAITKSSNGYIYIVQNARIHKVNPTTGSYVVLGSPEWSGTQAITAYQGNLYIVQNSHLHKVNENTGAYTIISGPDWAGTKAIASSEDGFIYIVQNSYLHKVNTTDGSYTILGGQTWSDIHSKGLTFYNNSLYAIKDGALLKVDKITGSSTLLKNAYGGCEHLTSL